MSINIKNISARHTIGNNKRILLTKIIILEIARELPSKETLIKEKPVSRFASQTTWLASKQCEQPLKRFMQLICKLNFLQYTGNCQDKL